MRIVCVQPARDPVACGDGPVRIGSAPDDEVVPVGAGAAPHHVTLTALARRLVLAVGPGCQRVYVNARAVRERAMLRYGDSVTLGNNRFLVTSDQPPPSESVRQPGGSDAPVALRVVSGASSGQLLAVAQELRLGAGSVHLPDVAFACRVTHDAEGVWFDAGSDTARVNGWSCRQARLAPGDQIALGEHRLVVEAPTLEYAAYRAAQPPPQAPLQPTPLAPDEPDTSPHTEVWWLILAGALLAAIIALFLYFRW